MGPEQDFSLAPWGGVGMSLDFLDPLYPALPYPLPTPTPRRAALC